MCFLGHRAKSSRVPTALLFSESEEDEEEESLLEIEPDPESELSDTPASSFSSTHTPFKGKNYDELFAHT